MNWKHLIFSTLGLSVVTSPFILAQQSPPNPGPAEPGVLPQVTPVIIEVSNRDPQSRLLIPRKLLANMQVASLDRAPHSATWFAWLPISVVALGLTAACGFGALNRQRRFGHCGVALLLFLLLLPGMFGIASAMTAVPTDLRLPHPLQDFELSAPLVVEVVETGDAIRLILNKNVPLHYRSR